MAVPMVSIIIVTYNGWRWLPDCLDSLHKQEYPRDRWELIVVDNASTDQTIPWLESMHPMVKVIKNTRNQGFAAANNQGVAAAKGEFVVLLNNDTTVEPDWLSHLIGYMEKNPQCAAVNGKTYLASSRSDEQPLVQNAGLVVFRSGYARDRGAVVANGQQSYEPNNLYYQQAASVAGVCGVSVAVRKTAWAAVGGFDESLFMYLEDFDLSLRWRRLGWQLGYEPQAITWHQHAASSGEGSPFFQYYTERNQLVVVTKYFPFSVILASLWRAKLRLMKSLVQMNWPLVGVRVKVLGWWLVHLPGILLERSQLKKTQTVLWSKLTQEWL
jgi:GT2 family glycosyltransferase